MQTNVYVDTNIIIDICDSQRIMHDQSFELITHYMEQDNSELFINSDTLANLFYILANRSTLNTDEVLDKMHFINEIFTLVSIETKDVEMALALCADSNSKHDDYEDSMQYVCAKKIEATLILTNDKKFVSVDISIKKTED
ncbi:MAG: PIN domain protein [uncultured Sulfurovum sp.]|uniref:PIN domain protein n=1 Tax=uncultured Sulfurovum sp. TaxID=269237 RepID=A0A6S6U5U8_9BACT|nr:MAG: PIN domain protein [uncultured Sulfurovum sp.]